MLKVLWLASWYPSEASPQNGDFIQRHAISVASLASVHVIHISAYTQNKYYKNTNASLTEEIVLYKKTNITAFARVGSLIKYFRLYKKYIRAYIKSSGVPDIVHVHIPVRAGLLAVWLKRKYKIPYVVTEHFSIYTTLRKDNYNTRGWGFALILKRVLRNTDAFLPVSNALGRGVNDMVMKIPFTKIPNVVDTNCFCYEEKTKEKFTFIHVSSMSALKNPTGIINAFSRLSKENKRVHLKMIGGGDEFVRSDNTQIDFMPPVSNVRVAEFLKHAHVFVLFSDSENLPCVIAESLCCGVPVIATDVGGVSEMINDENGLLVPPRDEEALYLAMKVMIENYDKYNLQTVAAKALQVYNYNTVGRQFDEVYREILNKTKE